MVIKYTTESWKFSWRELHCFEKLICSLSSGVWLVWWQCQIWRPSLSQEVLSPLTLSWTLSSRNSKRFKIHKSHHLLHSPLPPSPNVLGEDWFNMIGCLISLRLTVIPPWDKSLSYWRRRISLLSLRNLVRVRASAYWSLYRWSAPGYPRSQTLPLLYSLFLIYYPRKVPKVENYRTSSKTSAWK